MKITKFPQSCMVIEHNQKRIAIDPGNLVRPTFDVNDIGHIDAILITHEHADHADPALLADLAGGSIPVVANQSAQRVLGDIVTMVVENGESFEVVGIQITAHELPHMALPDGSAGPQNTGYVIDGAFFHPGDGLEIDSLQVPVTAVPIAGPDASPRRALAFVQSVGAQKVIPIHFDNTKLFPGSTTAFQNLLTIFQPDVQCIVIENGQSAEI